MKKKETNEFIISTGKELDKTNSAQNELVFNFDTQGEVIIQVSRQFLGDGIATITTLTTSIKHDVALQIAAEIISKIESLKDD